MTISDGTLQVEGAVTAADALTNQGTLRVVGTGVFTHGGTQIAGNAAAASAGEVFLTSTGLGSESTTFDFEISTDGVNYYPIATGEATDSQALLSGLLPDTNYYLRGRATHVGGGQEIYDGGMVTTGEGPGPGVPRYLGMVSHRLDHVRHGWQRLDSRSRFDGLRRGARIAAGDGGRPFCRRDPQVHVFGATGSPPPGSENIFDFDHSWFFAESAQGGGSAGGGGPGFRPVRADPDGRRGQSLARVACLERADHLRSVDL